MKPGKVVMVLAGRYAGRKAVIVKVKHESAEQHISLHLYMPRAVVYWLIHCQGSHVHL